jgi:hypothetical protein
MTNCTETDTMTNMMTDTETDIMTTMVNGP